jgi:hypothetical protein
LVYYDSWNTIVTHQKRSIADRNSPNARSLSFLVFTALLHELAHWINSFLFQNSDEDQSWGTFYGKAINDKTSSDTSKGEAGYYVEGGLWTGIISWAHKSETSPSDVYRAATHLWKTVNAILIQYGPKYNSVEKFMIREPFVSIHDYFPD